MAIAYPMHLQYYASRPTTFNLADSMYSVVAFAVGHGLPCSATRQAVDHHVARFIPWCSGSPKCRIDFWSVLNDESPPVCTGGLLCLY